MDTSASTNCRMKKLLTGNKLEILTVLIILSIGTALRFFHICDYSRIAVFSYPVGPDVQEYFDWASRIYAGEILWREAPIHAPLYPLFLALLMKISSMNIFAVRMIQTLFCLLSFLPFYFILRDNFPPSEKAMQRFIPPLFLLMICIYPPLIAYQSEFFSENLMLPLCGASLLFLHYSLKTSCRTRDIMLMASGISAVLAAVTHPTALFFIAAVIVFIFVKNISAGFKKTLRPLVLFILPSVVVIGLLTAYNSSLAGHPVMIQKNSTFNYYLGNNPSATGTCFIPPGPIWNSIHDEAENSGISPDRYFFGKSLDFISCDFTKWVHLMFRKTLYAFNKCELTTWSDISPLGLTFIHKYLYNWPFALIAIPGLASLIFGSFYIRNYIQKLQLFILLFIPFAATQIIFLTSGRYRLALIPPLIAATAYIVCSANDFFKDKKQSLFFCIALVAASIIVIVPVPPSDHMLEAAYADSALAESYYKKGDTAQSEKYLAHSFELLSDWDRTINLMGQIRYANGDTASAIECFTSAMQKFPDSYHAFMNMGTVMSDKGKLTDAAELYVKALKKAPYSARADIFFNIAEMEQRRGDMKKAYMMYLDTLKINPLHRRALNNLGAICVSEGKYSNGAGYFRKALSIEPDNPKIMINLAFAEMLSGNKKEALRLTEKALRLDPESKPAAELMKILSR